MTLHLALDIISFALLISAVVLGISNLFYFTKNGFGNKAAFVSRSTLVLVLVLLGQSLEAGSSISRAIDAPRAVPQKTSSSR